MPQQILERVRGCSPKKGQKKANLQLPALDSRMGPRDEVLELRRSFLQLCVSSDTHRSLPYPSIALSAALLPHGKTYWRQTALRLIAQLKSSCPLRQDAAPEWSHRLTTARLLLLYYLSCDATFGPMLVLEGAVSTLVRACFEFTTPSIGPADPPAPSSDTHDTPTSPIDPTVGIDYLRYTNDALCRDLLVDGALDFILPLGADSMLYLLHGASLPQNEVDECEARQAWVHPPPPPPPTASIFYFAPPSDAKNKNPPRDMAPLVAESASFQRHLIGRILTCLAHNCPKVSHEHRRLVQDGAVEALASLTIVAPPLNHPVVPPLPRDVSAILHPSFLALMARHGLAAFTTDDLHRVVQGHHATNVSHEHPSVTHHCRSILRTHLDDRKARADAHTAALVVRRAARAATRDPSADLKTRLAAVSASSMRSLNQTTPRRWTKAKAVAWVRHSDDVTRHLVSSLAVLRASGRLAGFDTLVSWIAHVEREKAAEAQRRADERATAAAIVEELRLMASEDKPPESELERKKRLDAKKAQLQQWHDEKRRDDERRVALVVAAKKEATEREAMLREDRYVPKPTRTKAEVEAASLAAETARIEQLRLHVREERQREMDERRMRLEDSAARQRRRQEWDAAEIAFKAQVAREVAETHAMRAEEAAIGRTLWQAIDEQMADDELTAKLAERKRQRAEERRKRRQVAHPHLYNDWETVESEPGVVYYYNKATGDVQWEDPKKAVTDTWTQVQDDAGNTYYVNAVTGESKWSLDEWVECKTDDGAVYYYNVVSGESAWTKPADV
ncbi:Aste57867_4361 [Aphanomyces stellatus]|uniref:Aste57867_4361 protein n=1 Tax=Aphanomyces stellatus TaxID=120398 RepID=A0A485KCI8_9STRA|nr:hypothetical protein As57867_004349 [Aphanomyces stellatus]VFT81475.1 Aste57867_4361 [Aphanomyces stellatus]